LIKKLKLKLIRFSENIIRNNFIHSLLIYRFFKKKENLTQKKSISVINTFDSTGGAAKIAYSISKEIIQQIPLKYFVREKKTCETWIAQIENKTYNFFEENLNREAKERGWIEFSGFHALNLLNDSFFSQSSIVHLHNLHGDFLSPALFKVLLKDKRVIWTLHDESFLTGHCSCTLGCEKWKNGCGECPDLGIYPSVKFDNTANVLKNKKKWINELQPIIVCPSNWLAERVKIAYPKLHRVEVIPNAIDTTIFNPRGKEKSRKQLGFPLDRKIVLFVAEFATNNPFKGGEIIRELISDFDFSDVLFITIGGKQKDNIQNHISYPYISDEEELALLYSASDILLYPTQADNLPLVILESMACGTPVIASKLGGIPEIINDSNGFLVNSYKLKSSFKSKLCEVLALQKVETEKISTHALNTIQSKFSFENMIQSYLKVYEI
jgi:glycosyltransferase involved in cell wall biosynthesis